MINVKSKVYSALCSVCDNVTDAFPFNFEQMPSVQYMEEENIVHTWTDNQEELSYVRLQFGQNYKNIFSYSKYWVYNCSR